VTRWPAVEGGADVGDEGVEVVGFVGAGDPDVDDGEVADVEADVTGPLEHVGDLEQVVLGVRGARRGRRRRGGCDACMRS
jgi:hypothetical protein